MDDAPLEGVPLPVYPLPNKPYPVQPPPKIGTGFAPVIPLDKSKKPVRRWRQANREIRGIAGGRWFIRSWIGEKESEFASAAAQQAAADREGTSASGMVALPKLSAISVSGSGRGRSKVAKGDSLAASRAGSSKPETISGHPLKKRTGSGHGASAPLDSPLTTVPLTAPAG